ncbi:phage tail protein I [Fodinicurvata sp. EGI_FJ10296]|uniref:phage tail protein I n=1 Tax=Fodinicurvata sp. EGI_FJ10296 TaxID=3231908 RepID=UPI003453DB38
MTEPAPYLVGSDQLTDGTGLRGFGTDGTPLWTRESRASALARHRDGWLVAGGASRVRRLDPDGAEIWSAEAGGTLRAVAVNLAGTVVAATASGVAAFDAGGAPLWTVPSGSDVWGVAIDRDGGIALARVDGRVERRDAGGALIWAVERGAAAIAVALTSAGGVIAAGSADGDGRHLNVYEADGTPRWSASFGTAPYIWAVAVDDRGHVTVGGAPDAGIVARQYTGDGDVVWSSTAGNPGQIRAVSVTPDGTVLTAGAWGSGPKAALLDAGTGTVIWTDDSFDRAASTAAVPGVRGGGHWRHEAERAAHSRATATLAATSGKRSTGAGSVPATGSVAGMGRKRISRTPTIDAGVGITAGGTKHAFVSAAVDAGAQTTGVARKSIPAAAMVRAGAVTDARAFKRSSGGGLFAAGAILGASGVTITDQPAEPLIVTVDVTVTAGASLDGTAGRIVGGTAAVPAVGTMAGTGHKRADRTGATAFAFGIGGHGRPHRRGTVNIIAGGTGRAVANGSRSGAAILKAVGTGEAATTATHYGRARVRIGTHGQAAFTTAKPTPTLLPSSATNEMRALEAVTVRATDLPALHRHNADPERVRSQLLPWQAWERAVDIWDTTWPDATKRAVSGRAIATHRIRGTPAAVESALASLGVDDAVLTEWFEDTPEGPPYTFRATVTRAGGIERGLTRNLGRAVAASKNTRSHMTRLTLVVPMAATTLHAAPAALSGQAVTVAPIWDPPGPIMGATAGASAIHSVTAVTVPAHNEDTDA